MILGLGVDILSLKRFESTLTRRGAGRLARRICCPRELAQFNDQFPAGSIAALRDAQQDGYALPSAREAEEVWKGDEGVRRRVVRFLSSRWAIKEAAYKSLHPSLPLLRTWEPDFRLTFHSFDLVHTKGVPVLDILRTDRNGTKGDKLDGVKLIGSLSHDAGVVVGVVIAQKDG